MGHENGVTTVAFSRDSKLLVSGSKDRTIRVWDTATWQLHQLIEHNREASTFRLLLARLKPAGIRIPRPGSLALEYFCSGFSAAKRE